MFSVDSLIQMKYVNIFRLRKPDICQTSHIEMIRNDAIRGIESGIHRGPVRPICFHPDAMELKLIVNISRI